MKKALFRLKSFRYLTLFLIVTHQNISLAYYFAGVGFDTTFITKNPHAPHASEMPIIDTYIGNKVTAGLNIRGGLQATLSNNLFLGAQVYLRFGFDVSGSGLGNTGFSLRSPDQFYIFTGLAPMIGCAFGADGGTKLYGLFLLEYMSAGFNIKNAIETVNEMGAIFLGFGMGMKRDILSFLTLFFEVRVLFDVFSHFGAIKIGMPVTSSANGSIGYQMIDASFGIEFRF